MQLTAFETGQRSPREFITAPDPRRKERRRLVPYEERQQRKALATAVVAKLGGKQPVAEALDLHATAVSRWVQGQTTVPAKHLPALHRLLEDA